MLFRSYVVDARYDEENEAKITELARDADVLYCEAPYLDCDAEKARERYHLTARQAGLLANRAGAKNLSVFHFSPRYTGQGDMLVEEARAAFSRARSEEGSQQSGCPSATDGKPGPLHD